MKERLFSTAELGRLLSVSEATVKRWADTDRIGCFRTPGGHRRFRICDIAGFVENTGFEVTGTLRSLLHDGGINRACEEAVYDRDLGSLVERFRECAVLGDVSGVEGIFSCLLTRGVCVATIVDEVVSPAFSHIGDAWVRGDLTSVDEHVATRATIQALDRIDEAAAPRVQNDLRAYTVCLEGERHDLGARAVASVLRSCGYRTVHIGGDTPVAELSAYVRSNAPDILALSAKIPAPIDALVAWLEALLVETERTGTHVIVGGAGFSLLPDDLRRKLTVMDSCRQLLDEVHDWEWSA